MNNLCDLTKFYCTRTKVNDNGVILIIDFDDCIGNNQYH